MRRCAEDGQDATWRVTDDMRPLSLTDCTHSRIRSGRAAVPSSSDSKQRGDALAAASTLLTAAVLQSFVRTERR